MTRLILGRCAVVLVAALLVRSAVLPPERAATSYAASYATAAWHAPLAGPLDVVRGFSPPPLPWLPGHRGVDLAAQPAAEVYALSDGVIIFAGEVAGRGVISIQHEAGLRSTYEPVQALVSAGAHVHAGELIGLLLAGHAGCAAAAGACLHLGLKRGETYLDPLAALGLGRVRLYPITATRRSLSIAKPPQRR